MLAWLMCVLLIGLGGVVSLRAAPRAQQPPAPDTTVFFETRVDAVPAGRVTVSASSLILPPGAMTITVEFDGALSLLVESGEIRIYSSRPIVGASSEGDGSAASEQVYRMMAGERVAIPPGARIRLAGAGSDAARLFSVSYTHLTLPTKRIV